MSVITDLSNYYAKEVCISDYGEISEQADILEMLLSNMT